MTHELVQNVILYTSTKKIIVCVRYFTWNEKSDISCRSWFALNFIIIDFFRFSVLSKTFFLSKKIIWDLMMIYFTKLIITFQKQSFIKPYTFVSITSEWIVYFSYTMSVTFIYHLLLAHFSNLNYIKLCFTYIFITFTRKNVRA